MASSDPYTSTADFELTTSQTFDGGANDSGTEIRLRQLDALHHSEPLTVRSLNPLAVVTSPGANLPLPWQRLVASSASSTGCGRSRAGKPVAATSQLTPMIGT